MTVWIDINSIEVNLESKHNEMFERDVPTHEEIDSENRYQEYDIKSDFQYLQKARNAKSIAERPYQLVK